MTQSLARRVDAIDASGIRRVFDLARDLDNPINLSIGQPDFPVPEPIKQAAIAAIRDDRNGYTPTQGIEPLREQILAGERAFCQRDYAPRELLITSGVSGGLFLLLLAMVDEGDEVLIPDPYFVMYKHLVRLFGGVPVYLDTGADGFVLDPDRLAAAITPRSKLLLLNSPANPTGVVIDDARLRAIAAICSKHGLWVCSDEIYRDFCYVPTSTIARYHERTIVLGGMSKTYGITGWRLGFALGDEEVIQAMTKVQQYSFVCAPSTTQYAALMCPRVDMSAHLDAYRAKRDLMAAGLRQRFELAPPDGAFYCYVRAPQGWGGTAFVEHCIRNEVLVIPGAVFSEQDSHFRVCYTVDDRTLEEGVAALCRLADDQPPA